ncbi:MAG: cobyrinate a,c-diamide synthase [Microcystaceae cyanobacterium]
MGLIIAGERSGVGKTTITLALLAFLARKGAKVQSFKVGPDYIDPMFHTAIAGRNCRNLDPVLTSETYVQTCYQRHSQGVDYVLVEGVMGLFDGIPRPDCPDFASTAHIARLLKLPVLLVIDCARLSGSVAAIAQGYRTLDPRVKLLGVILNKVGSDRHLHLLKTALETINLPIFGVLHRHTDLTIPQRHLGLVPSEELPALTQLFDRLAHLAAQSLDWPSLLPHLLPPPISPSPPLPVSPSPPLRLAIARDRAFNFYYADTLDCLQTLGAELIYWSPLKDERLPDHIQGLFLGGGFPEIFAETLSENLPLREQLKKLIHQGLPTYAECGGLMYLCETLTDFAGNNWPLVGILPTQTVMTSKLTLGYRHATVIAPSPLVTASTQLWGHEFHHSHLTHPPITPLFTLQGSLPQDPQTKEGWSSSNLHASYLHLHFGDKPHLLQKFLQICLAFSQNLR